MYHWTSIEIRDTALSEAIFGQKGRVRVPKRQSVRDSADRSEREGKGREEGGEKAVAANNCDNLLTCHRVVVELVAGRSPVVGECWGAREPRYDKNRLSRLKVELWRSAVYHVPNQN